MSPFVSFGTVLALRLPRIKPGTDQMIRSTDTYTDTYQEANDVHKRTTHGQMETSYWRRS